MNHEMTYITRLEETKDQVNRSSRTASTDKLFLENENRELRRK